MSAKGAKVLPSTKTQLKRTQQKNVLQKKHLSVEAKRISSILKNSISQVETAVNVSAALNSMSSIEDIEDQALSMALQKHREAIERLEKLEGLEQKSGWQRKAEEDIKNTFRDLLRFVRANPDAISALKADRGMEVGESESILIRKLEKFHGRMIERLKSSQEETVHRGDELFSDFMKKMAPKIEKKDATIKKLDAEVAALLSSLQKMQIEEVSLSSCGASDQPSQSRAMKHASIQQDIDQLKIQLDNLILENNQAEKILMEKNEKVEKETDILVQKFDIHMEEIQTSLELNQTIYEKEVEELTNLEKAFLLLEVEYNQVLERRRLAEQKREEEMRVLNLKTKAAILAQAWWRGYSTRKALKNKGKSKKAKKGKGKKKK